MRDDLTASADDTPDAFVAHAAEPDAIQAARDYGLDIGLINSLLDLRVIERIRRNDADAWLDRVIRPALRSRRL